jgi:hypothetical protein
MREETNKHGGLLTSTEAMKELFDAGSLGAPFASVEVKGCRSDSSDSGRAPTHSALLSASRGLSRQSNLLVFKSFPNYDVQHVHRF